MKPRAPWLNRRPPPIIKRLQGGDWVVERPKDGLKGEDWWISHKQRLHGGDWGRRNMAKKPQPKHPPSIGRHITPFPNDVVMIVGWFEEGCGMMLGYFGAGFWYDFVMIWG